MSYHHLCTIDLRHEYYGGKPCPDLELLATPATLTALNNLRCLLKATPGQLDVLIALNAEKVPVITLPSVSELSFDIHVRDSAFFDYTDLSALSNYSGLTDLKQHPPPPPPCFSHSSTADGQLTPQPFDKRVATTLARPVFATVKLTLHFDAALKSVQSKQFWVAFSAKTCHWNYYLVTDSVQQPRIHVADKATDGINFSALEISKTPDQGDLVATSLAAQYPGKRIWRLRSDNKLTCSQDPRKGLALALDNTRVVENLPNPLPQNMVRNARNDVENPINEDALYQVVKYVSH